MAVIKETTFFGKINKQKEVEVKPEGNKFKSLDPQDGHARSLAITGSDNAMLMRGKTESKNSNAWSFYPLLENQINEADLTKTRLGGVIKTVYRYEPKEI